MTRLEVRRRFVREFARLRPAVFAAGALAAAFAPAVADAGRVLQVRIGQHEDFTRVVFDLDEAASHRIVQSMRDDAQEIVVKIDAATTNRRVLSKSELVESVTLAPDGPTSTVARIALRGADVHIQPRRFDAPARIVIDLRPAGPAAPSVAVGEAAPVRSGARSAEPVREEAPPRDALAPAAPAIAQGTPADEPAEAAPASDAPPASAAAPPPDAEPAAPVASEREAEDEVAAAPVSPPPGELAATAPPTASATTALSSPNVSGAPIRPLSEGLDLRVLIGGLVVVLSIFLLWGVVGRRDRTSREVAQEMTADAGGDAFADRAAASWETAESAVDATRVELADDSAEEVEPLVMAEPEFAISSAPPAPTESGQAELPLARSALSALEGETGGEIAPPVIVDRTGPRLVLVPARDESVLTPPASATISAIAAVEAATDAASLPPGEAGPTLARVRELEQRIAQLEQRLEGAADSRERIERALVAQNEELRVQRAAIARTQRVLRSIAKPEEMAMEPVPRGPGGSASS